MSAETKPIDVYHAIQADEIAKAIELLDKNHQLFNAKTPFGSWLHVAASGGHLDLAVWLLEKGIDIDEPCGTFGGNALNYAASYGKIDVVRLLLERGSTMDVSEPERNPLFSAIYGGHKEVAKVLLDEGIDFRVKYSGKSMKNMDAKAFAYERGQSELVEILDGYETMSRRAI